MAERVKNSGKITPEQFVAKLYDGIVHDLIGVEDRRLVAAFPEQLINRWFAKPADSRPDREQLALGAPTKLTSTYLYSGTIALTEAGFVGVALHYGNADIFHDLASLKVEYAVANRVLTPWLFERGDPITTDGLRGILYGSGAQTRPIGRYEAHPDGRLYVNDPTVNYPGIAADTLSQAGQEMWLTDDGVREGVHGFNRLVTRLKGETIHLAALHRGSFDRPITHSAVLV